MNSGLWKPTSEADILSGVANGTIKESHFLEVKEEARNETIAQTLASLAIDGGLFILGIAEVSENGRKRFEPKPTSLRGLAERIDQIARNSIDPPLVVRSSAISVDGDRERGFFLVEVAASPLAPHMVGGKYYARNEASKTVLSDAEVRRYHHLQEQQGNLAERLLDREEERDYLTPSQRRFGHLYLVAQPLAPIAGPALAHLLDDDGAFRRLLLNVPPRNFHAEPEPFAASIREHRSGGIAMVSPEASGGGRRLSDVVGQAAAERGLLDIELSHEGGLRVTTGFGTTDRAPLGSVRDRLYVSYAMYLVAWVGNIVEATGYGGSWGLGLRGVGLKGLGPEAKERGFPFPFGAMDEDRYSRTCIVSRLDIEERPKMIALKLVGDLVRVLGTIDIYKLDDVSA
jgi:hypothetical protein